MIAAFKKKAMALMQQITTDRRWDIEDQTLFVVMGMTYYGYCLGYGKLVCMLDDQQVNEEVVEILHRLGAGDKYVRGLISAANTSFYSQEQTLYNQLVNIGHNYFMMDQLKELVDGIYLNAQTVAQQR
ncbi:hypothetical protein [Myroides pelagicus]|uniref:Uncharacterized protein n=1 Tax=Myroides pelagicus TaxID=270914 RepID=A0A7K1GK12_9FLAO|nr:hypothetical protein [Myroides pelagicus]MTH29222.1 hypothetical protein [Myroides pelagicus]